MYKNNEYKRNYKNYSIYHRLHLNEIFSSGTFNKRIMFTLQKP